MYVSAKEKVGYGILGLLVLGIVLVLGYRATKPPPSMMLPVISKAAASHTKHNRNDDIPSADSSPSDLVVHVTGAVLSPGVYHLKPGERVFDAVNRAGGATAKADLQAINLAAKVEDAEQILVPIKGQVVANTSQATASLGLTTHKKLASGTISINRASLDQLEQLPGVGPATAQKIIDYRNQHAKFATLEELMDVGGIGQKKFEKIRPFVSL